MSTESKDASKLPSDAPPTRNAQGEAAIQFIHDEIVRARTAVKRTQIIGVILLLFVGGYMGFITSMLLPYLSPKGAANTAGDMILNQVTDQGPQIAANLKKTIPELVAQIPDRVLEQMPVWRERLEDTVEEILTENLVQHSDDFGKQLDTFLSIHQAEIADLLQTTDDKEKLKVLMTSIEQDILEFLGEPMEDGESIKQKLNVSLDALNRIEKQMERLATAQDLSPQEKKTRRAIAIISRRVGTEKLAPQAN